MSRFSLLSIESVAHSVSALNKMRLLERNDLRWIRSISVQGMNICVEFFENCVLYRVSMKASYNAMNFEDLCKEVNPVLDWKGFELFPVNETFYLSLTRLFSEINVNVPFFEQLQTVIKCIGKLCSVVPRDSQILEIDSLSTLLNLHLPSLDVQLSILNSALMSSRCQPVSLLCPCPFGFLRNSTLSPMESHAVDYDSIRNALAEMPYASSLSVDSYRMLTKKSKLLLDYLLFSPISILPADIPAVISSIIPSSIKPNLYLSVDLPSDPQFDKLCETYGKFYAYHGSSNENWYSIIRKGLLDLSYTPAMKSGAIFGRGIYLSSELEVSKMFSASAKTWDKSAYSHMEIVGVYAVANCPEMVNCESKVRKNAVPEKYFVIKDNACMKLVGLCVWTKKAVEKPSKFRIGFIHIFIVLMLFLVFFQNPSLQNFFKKSFRKFKVFK